MQGKHGAGTRIGIGAKQNNSLDNWTIFTHTCSRYWAKTCQVSLVMWVESKSGPADNHGGSKLSNKGKMV